MHHRLAILLAAFSVFSTPSIAQDLSNAQRDAAVNFTLHNTKHVLFHEIGHLFVDQLELPVLGREEDAVDSLAALLVLQEGEQGHVALIDTVDGWLHSESSRPSRGYVNSDFYGEHSLDIQRSFSMACLMVGSDFEMHTRYATRVGLPIDRQKSCAEDFRVAQHGWEMVLEPHRRTSDFGADVSVTYRGHGHTYADISALLRQNRVLENAADWISKSYVLPKPVRLVAEVCGEVNAFYVPDDREVILCYEWADFFYDLFVEDIMPMREHFALMRELKVEKISDQD